MVHLLRRVALLEAARGQLSQGRRWVLVHQYAGESLEEALLAEGVDREVSVYGYICIRRGWPREDVPGGAR